MTFFQSDVDIQLFKQINILILVNSFGKKSKFTDVQHHPRTEKKQTNLKVPSCLHANKQWEINARRLSSPV